MLLGVEAGRNNLLECWVIHGFCNLMGVPMCSFLPPDSHIHEYRRWLLLAHALGVVVFWVGFKI
mgnify:FL=1